VFLPEAGCSPDLRPGEERRDRIRAVGRFEHENRLLAREEHIVALELRDLLGVERWARGEEPANRLVSIGPKRQDEHEPSRRCCSKLKRGKALGDLADEAGLGHRPDRNGEVADPFQDDRRTSVDPFGSGSSDAYARDALVRNVLRRLEPFEAQAPRQELELPSREWGDAFAPNDSVRSVHSYIVAAISS